MRSPRRSVISVLIGPVVPPDVIRRPSTGTVRSVALVAVLLLASGVLATSVGGTSDGGVAIEQIESEVDVDDVLLAIDVEDDGDAAWTVEYRTRLDTDDREAAFEELQADIEDDPDAYTTTFEERMAATAADAADATGREMTVTEMSVRAERSELPREYGVITYTFRWSNFAAVGDEEMTVGDAIDGLFLDGDSALRIGWSDGWERADATPPPTERRDDAVVWQGPTSFAGSEPRLRLVPADSGEATPDDDGATADGDTGATNGDGNAGLSDGIVSATTVALLAVLLALGVVAVAARRGGLPSGPFGSADHGDGESPTNGGTAPDDAADSSTTDDGDEAAGDRPDSDLGADVDDDTESGETDTPFGAGVDPDLLSNEEKVLKLIEANGGRMKQKRVAEEFDWTAAKTSQVTKGLREEGELEGFRLGRENVLALPEEDPR